MMTQVAVYQSPGPLVHLTGAGPPWTALVALATLSLTGAMLVVIMYYKCCCAPRSIKQPTSQKEAQDFPNLYTKITYPCRGFTKEQQTWRHS